MSPASILMLVGAAAEAAALALLLRRQGWRKFPFFCIFLAWSCLSDLAMYVIQVQLPSQYNHYYLIETITDFILQFSVLVELSWSVIRPIRSSLPRQTILILTVAIALAGLVIWPLAGHAVPADIGPQSRLIFHLEETFAILRVALFIVMASFSQLLSIGWRDRELQIATGFGFYSIVSLLVAVIHSHQAAGSQYHVLDLVESLSYLGTLSYWLYSFSTNEQERKEFSPQMQQFLLLMGGGARSNRMTLTNLPRDRFKEKE